MTTPQAKGVPINDDPRLEAEADAAGARAARGQPVAMSAGRGSATPRTAALPPGLQLSTAVPPIQRAVGFEFETGVEVQAEQNADALEIGSPLKNKKGDPWYVHADYAPGAEEFRVEFVTTAVEENQRDALVL